MEKKQSSHISSYTYYTIGWWNLAVYPSKTIIFIIDPWYNPHITFINPHLLDLHQKLSSFLIFIKNHHHSWASSKIIIILDLHQRLSSFFIIFPMEKVPSSIHGKLSRPWWVYISSAAARRGCVAPRGWTCGKRWAEPLGRPRLAGHVGRWGGWAQTNGGIVVINSWYQ